MSERSHRKNIQEHKSSEGFEEMECRHSCWLGANRNLYLLTNLFCFSSFSKFCSIISMKKSKLLILLIFRQYYSINKVINGLSDNLSHSR